jgi:hypothetical protein
MIWYSIPDKRKTSPKHLDPIYLPQYLLIIVSRPDLEPTKPLISWGPGTISLGECCWNVRLTIHRYSVPRFRVSKALPLPFICVFTEIQLLPVTFYYNLFTCFFVVMRHYFISPNREPLPVGDYIIYCRHTGRAVA